jgi:hypothetical protein
MPKEQSGLTLLHRDTILVSGAELPAGCFVYVKT